MTEHQTASPSAEADTKRADRMDAAERQRAASRERFDPGERVQVTTAKGETFTGTVKECTTAFFGSAVAVIRDEYDDKTPPVALVVAERVKRLEARPRVKRKLPAF